MRRVAQRVRMYRNRIRAMAIELWLRSFYGRTVVFSRSSIGRSFKIDTNYSSNFCINIRSAVFRDYCSIRMRNSGVLRIEPGVFFNSFCSINCMDSIIIGDNCLFGEGVKIYDHNHIYEGAEDIRNQGFSKSPIVVGRNCWIGSNVTILKGVTIGPNCVIGVGCTVYQDVAPNTRLINKSDLVAKTYS